MKSSITSKDACPLDLTLNVNSFFIPLSSWYGLWTVGCEIIYIDSYIFTADKNTGIDNS